MSMWRRALSLPFMLMGALALSSVSCHPGNDDTDLLPPADFSPPPVRPLKPNLPGAERLGYGAGFYSPDVLGDGRTWHWMGRSGEVRLRNDGAKRRLRLRGGVPLEFMDGSLTIHIALNGRPIDNFTATANTFRREYVVAPEDLGTGRSAVLRLEASAVAHVPGDSRELGVSIEQLDWETVN